VPILGGWPFTLLVQIYESQVSGERVPTTSNQMVPGNQARRKVIVLGIAEGCEAIYAINSCGAFQTQNHVALGERKIVNLSHHSSNASSLCLFIIRS
jgi:hypothetical protein